MTRADKLRQPPAPGGEKRAPAHPPVGRVIRERLRVSVVCGFCRGQGRDPFNLMSPLSTCQVCGGTGARQLHPPLSPCIFCKGTGIYPGLRMTCTTCNGMGMVELPANALTCPNCGGTGRAADSGWPDSPLSCVRCKGKGVV